jgi:hypothetical protein
MFGDVLWRFGIIGLILYIFWIARTIWEVRILPNTLFIWAAILLYSVSGIIFRFRSFWLIVGLMMALLNMHLRKTKISETNNT